MKKLLSFLPLLLAGCGPCQEIILSPPERAWLAAYQPGEKITFRSNRGRTNTLTMLPPKEWHENTDCNRLESGNYQPIFSQIILQSATVYNARNPYFLVTMRKNNPDRPGYLTFSMAGVECGTAAEEGQPTSKLQQRSCTLTTTGQVYPRAYFFQDGQNATHYGTGPVRAFYWDRQAGLIRYDLADGETFELAAD
ncbi:hypothetical protein [Hymenobacter lucidus]|uniref:Lipoprotein n=1 Tax=Hymenobacter lucidus TaxID=2880930 RepID=A0ABS8ANY8_9BACT|nr:hypothetical protein [Hymenobacter lucidus]MCB2407920.1 hypothetical protein [Hymenobacter lucidus]